MNDQYFTDPATHDVRDPNPWLALYLDNSIPMSPEAKYALMKDNNSRSSRLLLPLIKLISKVVMFFIHLYKYFLPFWPNSSKTLHYMLSFGLKRFVSPEANLLIFRHFHVGSEILGFISKNIEGIEVETSPLKPNNFRDIRDDLFLKHDLNLYNFIIRLNKSLKENNLDIKGRRPLDLSMISTGKFDIISFPDRWTNILDLRSAIEVFTPFYQFFLTSNDFVRATNSLQLDETIGIYASRILHSPAHLGLINNRHPMIPDSTFGTGYRLVLHGLAAENLHAILVEIKNGKRVDGVIVTAGKE